MNASDQTDRKTRRTRLLALWAIGMAAVLPFLLFYADHLPTKLIIRYGAWIGILTAVVFTGLARKPTIRRTAAGLALAFVLIVVITFF